MGGKNVIDSFERFSVEEYWNMTHKMLTWPEHSGPDILIDDGGRWVVYGTRLNPLFLRTEI